MTATGMQSWSMRIRRHALPLRAGLLFCLVLCWMFVASPWYEPARLQVQGVTQPTGGIRARVAWHAGTGFNGYERREFLLMPHREGGHELEVEYTGRRYFASDGNAVVLTAAELDGRSLDLRRFVSPPARWQEGRGVILAEPGASFRFSGKDWRHLRLSFESRNHSGKVLLRLDGHESERDLYMANDEAPRHHEDWWFRDGEGRFSLHLDLPRHAVQTLDLDAVPPRAIRFAQVGVQGPKEHRALEVPPVGAARLRIAGESLAFQRWFEPVRFGQQVIFALLTTWLLLGPGGAIRRRGGVREVLLAPHRRPFWLMFSGAFMVYAAWLVPFWPGVMSVDSLKVWRAARLPETLINDHPVLNVLLYRWVQQIWDHVAAVSLLQVAATALLISWMLYRLRRWGTGWAWILPSYVFLLVSVPVGLYSIALWKDIPFALLTLFWAFTLADWWRRRRAGCLSIGRQQALALLLLYLALGLLRHNGVVYLVFIPAMLVLLGIAPRRRILSVLGVLLLASLLGAAAFWGAGRGRADNFVLQRGRQIVHQLAQGGGQLRWGLAHAWQILDISRLGHPLQDQFHQVLGDRQAWWFLLRSGWSDVYPHQPPPGPRQAKLRALALKIYHASLVPPWVYGSWNPLWLLPLLLLSLLLACWRPEAAIFSSVILVQALALLFLAQVLNWRYYYFVCLALWFLPPLVRGQRTGDRGQTGLEGRGK